MQESIPWMNYPRTGMVVERFDSAPSSSSNLKPMAKYTITMIRTYETTLEYDADTPEQALEQYTQDQEKYAVELEQCCVTSESYMLEEPIELL